MSNNRPAGRMRPFARTSAARTKRTVHACGPHDNSNVILAALVDPQFDMSNVEYISFTSLSNIVKNIV